MLCHLWTAVAVSHQKQLDRLATHVGDGRARPVLVLEGEVVDSDRFAARHWDGRVSRHLDAPLRTEVCGTSPAK